MKYEIELVDLIDNASNTLEAARYMLLEIFEGYFGMEDSDTKEARAMMALGYKRYSAFTKVLLDVMTKLDSQIGEMNIVVQKGNAQ